jgi:putative ABC transport system permease protein
LRTVLNKKSLRDLWILRWQSLSIILVVACGVALLAGIDMAFKSLEFTRDKFCRDLHFADLEILFIPTDINTIPDFSDIDGILKVEKRLLFPCTITLNNDQRLSGIFTFIKPPNPQINSFRVIDGQYVNDRDLYSVVIEKSLAKYHGFKPGDFIQIKIGEKTYNSKICGTVITPEFMTGTANPDFFMPGKGTLGVIYGNIDRNNISLGFTLVNDLLFKFSKGVDPLLVKTRILKRLQRLYLEKIIQQKDHFSYKYMELDLHGFKLYMPAIILIMGMLSFTITFVIYNRFIINQRKEIGTLLCLGYIRSEIINSFLLGSLVLGLVGSALGLLISLVVRNIFAYVQYVALDLPVLYTNLYLVSLTKGIIFGVGITLIPPFLLLLKLLKLFPYEIIREPVKQNMIKRCLLTASSEGLPFLSLESRYALKNIIRQKYLTISTIICIGLSLGIAISYITSITSINNTITDSFNSEHWDLCVDFFYPMYLDDLGITKKVPYITQYEPFIRKSVEIGAHKIYKDSNLLGINPKSAVKHVRLIDGVWLSGEKEKEIVLNQDIAKAIGIGVGELVELKINQKRFKLKVVGISAEFSVGQSVVPFAVAQDMAELYDETTGIFITSIHQSDFAVIKKALYKLEYVGRVTEKSILLKELLNQIQQLMGIVHISTVFSIIVALIFIYISTNLSIFERKGEFAILKSLGYGKKSIRKIILLQILVNGFLGGLFSIPIAIITAIFLNHRLSEAWYHIANHFIISDFIWIIFIAIVIMPLMALPSIKFIQDLEVSEILHQRSIE